ncbi:hypothetical protein Q5P01_016571 [Channa striata]|uniref:Uncharacterized protein n=1 Tax=Channa striata TaxID=64152 RepID=A0AA88MAI8_CHASR|nr:hypothetical protein Q5P01_016571 [Channa striata]
MEYGQKWGSAGKLGKERRTRCDQQQPPSKLRRNLRDSSGVTICIAACVLCLGVCIVVFIRTSELESRIVSLEQQREAQLSAWMLSVEQVEPVILGRLDQILDEKLAMRVPKAREVRDSHHSCLCPPEGTE